MKKWLLPLQLWLTRTRICISAGIIALLALLILWNEDKVSKKHQLEASRSTLENISATIQSNTDSAQALFETYHKRNDQILNDLKALFGEMTVEEVFKDESQVRLNNAFVLPYLLLVDSNGNVVLSLDDKDVGTNLCSSGLLTEIGFNQLITCSSEGVLSETVENKNYYFYATTIKYKSKNCYLVIGALANVYNTQMKLLTSLSSIIEEKNLRPGEVVIGVNPQNNVVTYCSDETMEIVGKTAVEVGFAETLFTGDSQILAMNGTNYNCIALKASDNLTLVEAVSTKVRYANNYKPTLWAVVLLIMTLVTTLSYALNIPRELYRKNGEQKPVHLFGSRLVFNKEQVVHVIPFVLWGIVLIFFGVFYCRTILTLSWAMNDVERPLNRLESELKDISTDDSELQEYCERLYYSKAKILATMIEMNPSCLNSATNKVHTFYNEAGEKKVRLNAIGNPLYSISDSEYLKELCKNNDFSSIQLFDEQGFVIASSNDFWYFELSKDPSDQSYAFRSVLDGKLDFLFQDPETDDEGTQTQYIGVPFEYFLTTDSNGNTRFVSFTDYQKYMKNTGMGNPVSRHIGMLQGEIDTVESKKLMPAIDLQYIMKNISLSNDAYVVVFDNSPEHRIVYTPNVQNLGKTAAELNVSDEEFSGSFNGFQKVKGVRYFECCRFSNGYFVAVATPTSSLFATRMEDSVMTTLGCLLAMLLILGLFMITSEDEMVALQLPRENTGSNLRLMSAWNGNSANEKSRIIINICLFFVCVYFLMGLLSKSMFFADSTIVQYVLSDKWERGLNIFALTKSVAVFAAVLVVVISLKWLIAITSSVTESRFATVSNLLISFLQYAAVIVAIFYSLYWFGMQPMSLLTSAGILTAVIGLGSQSLIADMLAGLVLVFEGTFHVGDVVRIGETVGVVQEIGIRTTIVRETNNNIIVFNNNSIKDLENLSVKISKVVVSFAIANSEPLEHVEEILKKELPSFKERILGILTGPSYHNINSVEAGCYNLTIVATCRSADRSQVTSQLNRELILMCNRNNIQRP